MADLFRNHQPPPPPPPPKEKGEKHTEICKFKLSRKEETKLGEVKGLTSVIEAEPVLFPDVLGDFGYDVTCQACRKNSRYRTRFQASSGNSDSATWPGYEAEAEPPFPLLTQEDKKRLCLQAGMERDSCFSRTMQGNSDSGIQDNWGIRNRGLDNPNYDF